MSFKQTNTRYYAKWRPERNKDTDYWEQFKAPVLAKEFGPIDYINFSSVNPYYFAVTCSVRVQVYNPVTNLVYKNFSRFKEAAYGGSFRSDGKLLCVGGEECKIRLFDVKNKTCLRVLNGHNGAVHRCFFTHDNTHIASFSDDKTVAVWDIATETRIANFDEHQDYIRAGAVSPVSGDIVLSGSYDNKICMYDKRINKTVFKVDHGAPVESVMFLPTGGIFLSAGGTQVNVWDALAGGRLLAKLSHHHKTVTSLHLARDNKRFMSGSLDRHVKIYDLASYQVVHTLDYPNSILSLAVSPDDQTIVVGTVDGLVAISQRKSSPQEKTEGTRNFRYTSDTLVEKIVRQRTKRLKTFDDSLRRREFSRALDCVLDRTYLVETPEVVVAVCQELMRRKKLEIALAGRDSTTLSKFLRFLIKYLGDYRFTQALIDVTNIFLDTYEGDPIIVKDPKVHSLVQRVGEKLREEEDLSLQLAVLQGMMQMLLSGANATTTTDTTPAISAPSISDRTSTKTVLEVNK